MEINFGDDINDVRGSVLVVPEPSNWVLMLVGLLTCSTVAKRRRNAWPRGVNTTARFAVCLPFVWRLFAVCLPFVCRLFAVCLQFLLAVTTSGRAETPRP
jgi:hypothetical protein